MDQNDIPSQKRQKTDDPSNRFLFMSERELRLLKRYITSLREEVIDTEVALNKCGELLQKSEKVVQQEKEKLTMQEDRRERLEQILELSRITRQGRESQKVVEAKFYRVKREMKEHRREIKNRLKEMKRSKQRPAM